MGSTVVIVGLLLGLSTMECSPYHVIYQWNQIDIAYPTDAEKQAAIVNKSFIPKNIVISGVKIWKKFIYVTLPRLRPGVPIVMARLPYDAKQAAPITNIALEPWPAWSYQGEGECNKVFKCVQGTEIDQFGRMWILDVGRVDLFVKQPPDGICPAKLVIIDLQNDKILSQYRFPATVVDSNTNYLNDLVIACTDEYNCFAYITNPYDNQLVIYDHLQKQSWIVTHPTMKADPTASNITILGKTYTVSIGIDGIALSPRDAGFDRIYYAPIASYKMYSVSKKTLLAAKSKKLITLEDKDITDHGKGVSQVAGLAIDANGIMYYGRLSKNSLATWNTNLPRNFASDVEYLQNDRDLRWLDALAFDNQGQLVFTTNRIQLYLTESYNFSKINFRIIRTPTIAKSKSYMYSRWE